MLSEKIYELRRKQGLSQEQLAERIGVSRQAISKWESGQSIPDLDKLILLSENFSVSLDALVKESESEEAEEVQGAFIGKEDSENKDAFKETVHVSNKKTDLIVGLICSLLGVFGLFGTGLMILFSPAATENVNASSTVTINGTGILLTISVLPLIFGGFLILRKKK